MISIHALREEGDGRTAFCMELDEKFLSTPSARRATSRRMTTPTGQKISIHALREEGDFKEDGIMKMVNAFLSTPSARRATGAAAGGVRCLSNFYPRPPRGGRPLRGLDLVRLIIFLSTPSARRATVAIRSDNGILRISIHALREEGDGGSLTMLDNLSNFYPRPPRGGRRCEAGPQSREYLFLSTPSARRATDFF